MAKKEKLIDAYIAKSADFAKPILNHLRKLVHDACPEVEEKVKWGMPFFDYKNAPMCNMAAFKQHAAFGFWKASLMKDKSLLETAQSETAMGHVGRIASLKDLPSDKKSISWVKEAMKLNDEGIKVSKKTIAPKQEIEAPEYFTKALKKDKKALATFEGFSPSAKREYLDWVTSAKTEETKLSRLTQAIEWMAEGKKRNWKYEVK